MLGLVFHSPPVKRCACVTLLIICGRLNLSGGGDTSGSPQADRLLAFAALAGAAGTGFVATVWSRCAGDEGKAARSTGV